LLLIFFLNLLLILIFLLLPASNYSPDNRQLKENAISFLH
jgi:hypothetical protein